MRACLAALVLCLVTLPASAERCEASRYSVLDHDQNGTKAASGIKLSDKFATVAHKTFPLRSYVRVVNLRNGRSLVFMVTDRGPYHAGRCVDLSVEADRQLACEGGCPVEVTAQ